MKKACGNVNFPQAFCIFPTFLYKLKCKKEVSELNDYMIIIIRTVLLYIILLVVFRLMGKREVGELSIVDLAIFVLMAEVAALALDDIHREFSKAILPIILLFLIQYLNSWSILKNKRLRDFIEGDPTMVSRDGCICE